MSEESLAVIGGGVIGLAVARRAALAGWSVRVHRTGPWGQERGEPGGTSATPGASWVAGGMLAPHSEGWPGEERLLQIGLESLRLWHTGFLDGLPDVTADKMALRRVVTNLVANAIHYTPQGSQIGVYTVVADEHVRVVVEDNGRGIPAHDLKHLFQRFAQGTSKHRTTGTGLGLYLSRQIIEAHGGTIWAESVEGEGSRFMFELPL